MGDDKRDAEHESVLIFIAYEGVNSFHDHEGGYYGNLGENGVVEVPAWKICRYIFLWLMPPTQPKES